MQLPIDCKAWYYEDFLRPAEGKALWDAIEANFDLGPTVIVGPDGERLVLPNGTFNFADEWIINSRMAEPWGQRIAWIEEICPVKEKVEAITGRIFDVCVGYYYPDGTVGFPYHCDVPCIGDSSILAAVSIGYERVFSFRRVDDHGECHDVRLADGSLIVMGEHCRARYEHGLLVDPSVKEPRLVLVFMNFYGAGPGESADVRTET
jgi:hypothetical protein